MQVRIKEVGITEENRFNPNKAAFRDRFGELNLKSKNPGKNPWKIKRILKFFPYISSLTAVTIIGYIVGLEYSRTEIVQNIANGSIDLKTGLDAIYGIYEKQKAIFPIGAINAFILLLSSRVLRGKEEGRIVIMKEGIMKDEEK